MTWLAVAAGRSPTIVIDGAPAPAGWAAAAPLGTFAISSRYRQSSWAIHAFATMAGSNNDAIRGNDCICAEKRAHTRNHPFSEHPSQFTPRGVVEEMHFRSVSVVMHQAIGEEPFENHGRNRPLAAWHLGMGSYNQIVHDSYPWINSVSMRSIVNSPQC